MVYYAYHSIRFFNEHKIKLGVIVPSGNLGNATAAFWTKILGFPLREIVLATNANMIMSDYLATGQFLPRPSINTLANAMDIGNPSNFERLQYLFPDFADFKQNINTISADDKTIQATIKEAFNQHQQILCPHTACAYYARKQLSKQPWVVVATAHPIKFEDVIKPIIQQNIPMEKPLKVLLDKPIHKYKISKNPSVVIDFIRNHFFLNDQQNIRKL